jgi:FOG: GGDEF domain
VAAAAVQAVREQDIIHDSSLLASQRVTLSAGCASLNTERENRSAQLLIRQADMALYSAKQAGRNQVKSDESYLNTHS